MSQRYPFQAKALPYSLSAFCPYCDPDTLYLHHHQYYMGRVQELNRLAAQHRLTNVSLEDLLTRKIQLPVPQAARLRDAAGAVYNHELYFDSIRSTFGAPPLNRLTGAITGVYGSMEMFRRMLLEAAESLPGAGWVWLAAERNGVPHIILTENNEVIDLGLFQPLFVIDLWEHAYFLDDQFNKEKYLDAWFPFIDWEKADARFQSAHGADVGPR